MKLCYSRDNVDQPSTGHQEAPKSTRPPVLVGFLAIAIVGAVVWWMISDALGPSKKDPPTEQVQQVVPAASPETFVTVKGGALVNISIEALVKAEELVKDNEELRNLAAAAAPIPGGASGKLIGAQGDFRQIRVVDIDGTDLDVWLRSSSIEIATGQASAPKPSPTNGQPREKVTLAVISKLVGLNTSKQLGKPTLGWNSLEELRSYGLARHNKNRSEMKRQKANAIAFDFGTPAIVLKRVENTILVRVTGREMFVDVWIDDSDAVPLLTDAG